MFLLHRTRFELRRDFVLMVKKFLQRCLYFTVCVALILRRFFFFIIHEFADCFLIKKFTA